MPSEELRETVKAALPSIAIAIEEWLFNGAADDAAALTIAGFFAPILAEKERLEDELEGTDWHAVEAARQRDVWKSRALDAEAALAAERERCAKVAEGWAEEHAAHLTDDAPSPIGRHRAAMNDGYALAAAIRAQGQP